MDILKLATIATSLGIISVGVDARPVGADDERASSRDRVIEQFDHDGDGQWDERAEAKKSRCAKMFERFDTDGTLDEQERVAAREARRNRLLERFDANGDGEIDEYERAEIRKAGRRRPVSK